MFRSSWEVFYYNEWAFLKVMFRSSHSEVFLRKGVLKICSKFAGEHPCRSAISKVAKHVAVFEIQKHSKSIAKKEQWNEALLLIFFTWKSYRYDHIWLGLVMIYLTANIYFKINNKNTRKKCKICSELTMRTPECRQGRHSGIFIVNFEHISHLFLVFLLLTWKK